MLHTHTFSLTHLEPIITEVLHQKTDRGKQGWRELCKAHPSDIADLAENISTRMQHKLFALLPLELAGKTFERLENLVQVNILRKLKNEQVAYILKMMHADNLVDLLEHLKDSEVKTYLKLLQKHQRSHVLNLLTFDSKSAGGIMNSEVFTLTHNLTVKNSIGLLQRVSPGTEIRYRIYVTDTDGILVGHTTLDKLVLNKPDTPLKKLITKNEVAIPVHDDQELAVQKMTHYGVLSAPVIDEKNTFLGVITADDIFEVLEEETSEDVYRMSGVGHVEHSYFETSSMTMLLERSKWLVGLLLLQSLSSIIMQRYDHMLSSHVIISLFLTMLIGTGGNAGNQSATLVIRGLATGEIGRRRRLGVLIREFGLSLAIAALLSTISFARVWFMHHNLLAACAISLSLFCIVTASMFLGTLIPLTLHRLGIDPAHSAAPFLATLMDILGIIIYCSICSWILL